jgi:hypothetical protein
MKALLVLIFIVVCFFNIANAQASEKLLVDMDFQVNEDKTYVISGLIKSEKGKPIEDATVQISSVMETAKTESDSKGMFTYVLPTEPSESKFSVSIKAQKEGYLTGYANTSFFVKDENQVNMEKKPLRPGFKVVTSDKIKNDPIAFKILQNIELNKQKDAERQKMLHEIEEYQRFIEEQRQIANQNLLNDLQIWFEQFDPFKPRNAFSSFVSEFDSTIQNIYWGQFNFTEAKTREGLMALEQVLNSGGTMQEARKAFYEKAATPQSELNKINNELNAKYAKNDTRSRPD